MKIKFKYKPKVRIPIENMIGGEKVVCIDNKPIKSETGMPYIDELELGKRYTFSQITKAYSEKTIRCEELCNTHLLSNFAAL